MSSKSPGVNQRTHAHRQHLIGLLWHVGAYLIIGVLLIVLDLLSPGGLSWSFWVLGFWGVGLAFHILTYFIDGLRE